MRKFIGVLVVALALSFTGTALAKKPVHNAPTSGSAVVTQTGTTACFDFNGTCPVYSVSYSGLPANTLVEILFTTPVGTGILANEFTTDANGNLTLSNIVAIAPGTYTYSVGVPTSADLSTAYSNILATATWVVSA